MELSDPSLERRRREFVSSSVPLSTLPAQNSSLMTLSDFFRLMVEKGIDGPHEQTDIHLIGKHLGSGAQFDVYGHQHVTRRGFPSFDEPYVSTGLKASSAAGEKPVVVAIKRPRFKFRLGDYGAHDPESSSSMGFGTPSQLRALELEVHALCEDSIRSHRNVVKLLAWGLESENVTRGIEPLAPFLILEHGNCSLRAFLDSDEGSISWQVLQQLALDVSQGLSVLHASKIIHGDLKTDNVLVFPDQEGPFFCVAKLSDFGLSVIDQTEKIFDIGTPGWQAPELPSNKGIGAEMLVKCDYFSLGLVIFSTILMHGEPPLKGPPAKNSSAFELARRILTQSDIPPSASDRISSTLECLLQHHPADRASDLEGVCHLLGHVDKESFDNQGSWVNGRFNDNTPWGELLRTLYGNTMILGVYSERFLQSMALRAPSRDMVFCSWLEIHAFLCECPTSEYSRIANYYISNIDLAINQRTQDENLSMEVVGQEIAGHQLLGLCFNDKLANMDDRNNLPVDNPRVARRLRGSCAAVAATKGYFPAQAVALQLLEDTSSRFLERVRSNNADLKWQWNAVSTGYILAWEYAHESPREHVSALEHFRKSGGYNSHYICPLPKSNLTYGTSGLLHNPLVWLSEYPLHYAAVHGDVLEIERLLGDHHVDSVDGIGETALQRACMAGVYSSVRCLIERGADPTIQSKRLGTVPLHWLFVFDPKDVYDTAILLTSKEKSVLNQSSVLKAEAFHYPFKWPTGTPLEWAVLSNRSEAVNVLLGLGSTLDSITDFFPGPPNWNEQVYGTDPEDMTYGLDGRSDDPDRKLCRVWIYYAMEQYRLSVVQSNLSYQNQFQHLSSGGLGGYRAGRQNMHMFNTYGVGLNTAVLENDFDTVKKLIALGADVNHVTKARSRERTVLMTAIDQKNPDIVQLLLDNGARFDGSDYPGSVRPLYSAVQKNHLGIVKMLLDRGAEVNAKIEAPHGTVLICAVSLGRPAIAKLLLQYGADPLLEYEGFRNALEAATYDNNSEMVDLFLEKGANPNTPGSYDKVGNALQQAAHYGNVTILRALLDRGADPNIRGGLYETAIQAAINPATHHMWKQQTAVVKLLLERRVDVTISGGKYGSIMQAAACSGDVVLAKLLLDAGAPVNIGGGPHGSALQAATSWTEDLSLLQLLLDNGADPDFGGEDKWNSPLQVAVHHENRKQVELLLNRGADPNIQGGLYGNILKTAEKSGNSGIVQMLLDWGAQDESEPDRWNMMLDRVGTPPVSHSDVSSVRFLLLQCFERPKKNIPGVASPLELVNKVIDFAQYWLVELSQRRQKIEVSKDMQDTPYLQAGIKTWPSLDTRVRRIVFRIKSRDMELVKAPKLHRDDPYYYSHTWFEVGVRSTNSSETDQSCLIIQKNFCGSLATRTHNITWDVSRNDPRISKFLNGLNPGDTLDVYARSKAGERPLVNYVESVEVLVFYNHRTLSTSPSPIVEAPKGESSMASIGAGEPSPMILETSEIPPPNSIKPKTTEDTTSTLGKLNIPKKKTGLFSKVVSFFARCFT